MMRPFREIFGLKNQVAVVTGAGSGLGRVFSWALADAGADIILMDINPAGMEETAVQVRSLGRKAHTYTVDVSNEEQVATVFAEVDRAIGAIDILVNNAGIGDRFSGMIHDYPSTQWRQIIDVNLNSVFYCSRAVLKGMHDRQRGKIINIGSIWGAVGGGFLNVGGYAATKGAVVNLTREMALQYAPHNIQINAICPGFHHSSLGHSEIPDLIASMEQHTPAARIADASELQGTIVYLASSASNFMCGSIVAVDGGFLAQ